jgi:ferredoxin
VDDLQSLREQAESLKQEKQQIERRIRELPSGRTVAAFVEDDRCTRCGVCVGVCPNGAIHMNEHAVIDSHRCSACAACISACPNGAIVIKQVGTQ